MNIAIKWFNDNFNVELSNGDKDPFITVRGCRIVNGQNGEFVSWPATKNQNSGKWWNHVYASDEFSNHVLAKAKESKPQGEPQSQGGQDFDSDVPFSPRHWLS